MYQDPIQSLWKPQKINLFVATGTIRYLLLNRASSSMLTVALDELLVCKFVIAKYVPESKSSWEGAN